MSSRRDGWDARVRVGILTPHADIGPEAELGAMAPPSVSIHAARVPFGAMAAGGAMDPTIPLAPVRAFAEPPGVDEAASMLAAAPLDVIGFGFTSSAYVIGADGEAAMISRLERATQGVPVVATGAAATAALRACGVVRLALVSPPWFDAELDGLGARYFSDQGFEVIAHAPCALPPDQARIDPAELIAWVLEWTPPAAEAVFIGGNGMRAVGVIEELEHRLERPVLSANQVLLWSALAKLASPPEVTGYGSLFAR